MKNKQDKTDLIKKCVYSNIINEGHFRLKSGTFSKYYFNFKNLVSYPKLLIQISEKIYSQILSSGVKFSYLAAIAIGGLPVASFISTKYNIPMIIVRCLKKDYGMEKQIDGEYKKYSKCILIDDVITSGGSLSYAINSLHGDLNITGIWVILDRREKNEELEFNNCKYKINSLLTKEETLKYMNISKGSSITLSEKISKSIKEKKSFLCVGLDIDINKIPKIILECEDPVFEFAKKIIDSTNSFVIAYKINISFFEPLGEAGIKAISKICDYLKTFYPEILTIADAKKGDIGNTSKMHVKTYFDKFGFDSITVSPYMGHDSIEPFLEVKNKFVFLLAVTSNKGSKDFQKLSVVNGESSVKLYQEVVRVSKSWKNSKNIMYVVGASNLEELSEIRGMAPEAYLLVPGLGTQGGNLNDICKYGLDSGLKLIVNSSRSIIYSSIKENFAESAKKEVERIQGEMEGYIDRIIN